MAELTPEQIFNSYKNGELTKSATFGYLRLIIENDEISEVRVDAIQYLGDLTYKSEDIFELLENLMISDTNELVRVKAIEIIVNNYLEKAENLIKWTIKHENSMTCLLEMFKSLQVIKNNESLNLISFLEETIEKRFSNLDFYERELMGLGCLERYMGKVQPYLSDMTLFYDLTLKETEKLIDEFESLLSESNLEQNYSDYGKILKKLGDIYREPGKNEDDFREKCLNILFRVSMLGVKIDTKNKGLWINLGYAYEQKAEIDKAIDAFTNALNLNNLNDKAVFNNLINLYDKKARKLIKAGEYEKALEIYENKIINYVKDKCYLQKLSSLYKELNLINRGIETFRQIIESDPNNTTAWFELGLFYERNGKYTKAAKSFEQVIKFDTENLSGWYKIGSINRKSKNFDKAIKIYKQVLKIDINSTKIWDFLIFAYNLKGNRYKARKASKQALELEIEFRDPWNQLAYAYYDNGLYNEAVDIIQLSLELSSQWNHNGKKKIINNNDERNLKQLSEIYSILAKFKSSIQNNFENIIFKDSLNEMRNLLKAH